MTRVARRESTLLAWVALVVVYVFWGSTFLAIRVGLRQLPPATFSGARFVIAGAVLYAVALRGAGGGTPRERVGRRQWLGCTVVGTLLLSIGNGGVTFAEQHLDSGLAAVLVASIPLWMIVFAAIADRRRPAPSHVAGVVCGLVGVAVLASGGGTGGHPGSVVLVLVAAVGWALGSVLAGRLALPHGVLLSAGMQMLAGGAVLLLVGAARGEYGQLELGEISPKVWLAFAWLVLAGSILAFSSYGYALAHLPLPTVATYAYVNPVIAVLLGVAVLGEHIGVREIVGTLIVVGSVALAVRRLTPAAPTPLDPPEHA